MKYRKKPVAIEAITFEEFVEYGKTHGGNVVDGMPLSFEYHGHPITHECNDRYIIPTLEGMHLFTTEDMLLTGVNGEIYPCKKDIFEKTYEKVEGMTFCEAFAVMLEGGKVKLPSWGGYWYWDKEKKTIMMKCKAADSDTGKDLLDIRETQRVEYTLKNILRDDWMLATGDNCSVLGGYPEFSFSDAIRYLKRGLKVARKGWNGKGQYIELAKNVSYVNPDGEIRNVNHADMGNKAIAFVGTSGVQLGWLASQSDMLSEDWVFAKGGLTNDGNTDR